MSSVDPLRLAERWLAAVEGPRDTALAVINGAIGDRLAEIASPLAIAMTLLQRDPWRTFAPPVPARACLLVHGLMGNERSWEIGVSDERPELGRALAAARGVEPLYLRYNTGLHVSTNGRALANLLERTLGDELDELTIVAHSMGGLVVRSACHYAAEAKQRWLAKLQRVFLLGVPSHGSPVEQLAHVAAFTLSTIWNPWTKLIGAAINLRSAGIKDLRHGFLLDEDWMHRDLDELALRAPRPPIETPHVHWHVIAGALGAEAGWIAKLVGDGLVGQHSVAGRGFGTPAPGLLPDAELCVLPGVGHIGLMGDPAVLAQLQKWWTITE